MISLNVQWIPVNDRSGTYQWKGNDVNSRKVKTVTFFGTGEMRGQQAKAVTPPGSDYTDAYLSAFAAQPIPTRHVHRLSTAVFDNSTPIPLKPTSRPLSTSSSIKTSQTRLTNVDDIQTSTLFDKSTPTPSNRSSTYSSSFVPEKSTTYEPFSTTKFSSPQSQTFTSSYSTLLRTPTSTPTSTSTPSYDYQRSYTTFPTYPRPLMSAYTPVSRSEIVYENIYKPLPPYSVQSYPPSNTYTTSLSSLSSESTYKSYVPLPSIPLSSSFSDNRSRTYEPIVFPTSTIPKPIGRPETLLFQHDEDLRSSQIEKPSPLFTPSPQSPLTRPETKVESEPLRTEELSTTTSEPIKILETTLSKYDSLINQISEVLASVSPLSSTVSSMSPGKSVLDYQLSSDSSPVIPHKRIEPQPTQQSTVTSAVKSNDTQRPKQSHLIREDSYDKIVTAISDLDQNMISPSDAQKPSSINEEEPSLETEKVEISSASQEQTRSLSSHELVQEQPSPSAPEEEIKPSSLDEYQTSLPTEDEKKEEIQVAPVVEDAKDETKSSLVEEQQTSPELKEEELKTSSTDESQAVSTTEEQTKVSITDKQESVSVTEEEKDETTKTPTTSPDEPLATSPVEETKEETISSTTEPEIPVKNEEEVELKTSTTSESEVLPITEEEKKEETTTISPDEPLATSLTDEKKEEVQSKTSTTDESEVLPIIEEEKKEEATTTPTEEPLATSPLEEKKEETTSFTSEPEVSVKNEEVELKTSTTNESEVLPISEEQKKDETTTTSADETSATPTAENKKEELLDTSSVAEPQIPVTNEEVELKTSTTNESEVLPVTDEGKKEETTTTSLDEPLATSTVEEKKEETISSTTEPEIPVTNIELKTSTTNESEVLPITEEEKKDEPTTISADEVSASPTAEDKKEELVTSSATEHEISVTNEAEVELKTSTTNESEVLPVTEEAKKEETTTTSADEASAASIAEEKKEELATSFASVPENSVKNEEVELKTSLKEEEEPISSVIEQENQEIKTQSSDELQTSTVAEEKREETIAPTSETEIPVTNEQEEEAVSAVIKQENQETKTQSSDERQIPSVTEEKKEETEAPLPDEQPAPSTAAESSNLFTSTLSDTSASEILPSNETKSYEETVIDEQSKADIAQFVQQQTGLLTDVPSDVPVTEEVKEVSVSARAAKKARKHVTWDETVVDNEEDESSSDEDLMEENDTTVDVAKITADQDLTSSNISESQSTSEQLTSLSTSTTLSTVDDEQATSSDSAALEVTSLEQQITPTSQSEDETALSATATGQIDQIENEMTPSDSTDQQRRSSSPLPIVSTLPESTTQLITSSDLIESPSSLHEQQTDSISPPDTPSISTTDSSKEDTLTVDEVSTATSDILSNEIQVDTSLPLAEGGTDESDTSAIENATKPLQPVIVSPIDTLADTVSNRYISSDVYHGYLGDHQEFSPQDLSDIENESTKKSLLASLRETITTPITPLIETIQSVVSSMQTTSITPASKSDSEVTDHVDDQTRITTAATTESTETVTDEKTLVEEVQPIVDTSEKYRTIFESLREVITAPITAISETIQTAATNLQSDNQEVSSTVDTEYLATSLDGHESSLESESSSNVVSSSDEYPHKEIEQTQPSLFDSIRDKVSQTITTLTETIQNVIPTNAPSTEIHTEDEQVIEPEKCEAQFLERSAPADIPLDETVTDLRESSDSLITDSTISTSSDNTVIATEQTREQTEEQGAFSEDSSRSEIPETISADQQTKKLETESTESIPIIPHDEQVSAASPTTLEQTTVSIESSPSDIPSTSSADQKVEDETLESSVSTSSALPEQQIDLVGTEATIVSAISNEASVQQELDENTSTETRTTLEVIRDAITHPITTITETIQSIIPSSSSEESSNVAASEQKTESTVETEQIQSSETKSTFETIRDVLTHPIATITEKLQSSEKESSLETADVSKVEEQLATSVAHETVESKTAFESFRDAITHPIATITEKIQNVISSSTPEEVPSSETEIATPSIDKNKDEGIISTVTESSSDIISNPSEAMNQTSTSQVEEQILTTEGSEFHTQDQIQGEQEISSVATSSLISEHEKSESALELSTNQEIQDSFSPTTDDTEVPGADQLLVDTIHRNIVENELTSEDTFTWNNLVGEKSTDEEFNQSYKEIQQLLDENIQPLDNTANQQTLVTSRVEDVMQRSSNELESDSTSAVTEIENVPSTSFSDYRESSPLNTEEDSLELIHALHGHSILHPSSSPLIETSTTTNQSTIIEKAGEPIFQAREKSSSSTTSSQVTSSDRYVSYAIHEMGDSSQERLPSFPLAADIPVYEFIKTTSDENQEQQILSKPVIPLHQNLTKDDDLTELDATENLTSYSDDLQVQKLRTSAMNQRENLDASSTDEDVDDENFNEFEQGDVSNLHRIMGEITQQNSTWSGDDGHVYQRYDLSSNSSTSTKPQTDDIYIIPGYPGLWRPSADDLDDEPSHSSFANDADDEEERKQSNTPVKTRTIVRTSNPAKFQSFLQQSHDLSSQDIPFRPDTIDIFNRPLNEFPFDASESDSFKTCASTLNSSSISKQQQQQQQSGIYERPPTEEQEHQTSPDENIFLIRERERGVSLPVTMKIDYDDMALRLSTSTPIDAQLYSTTQTDLPSPSTQSEPMQKTSRSSTPSLSSNESEQQKPSSSSWLNTVNTITTTIEGPDGPLESRTTIHKSAKGPISVAECDAQGKHIIIENTSRSKSIALAGWILRQENDNGDILTFTFPDNCLLRPNHTVKVLAKSNESERRNSDLIAPLSSTWHTGSNVVTTLINADGKDRASLTKKTLFS